MNKDKKNINIKINNDEETKSQIVYNNIISSMEKMGLSKDEQVDYLKFRITELEQEQKNKLQLGILIIIFTIFLALGLFLIIQDLNTIGVIFSFGTFFIALFLVYKFSKTNKNNTNNKYEEIETIRKLINSRLK